MVKGNSGLKKAWSSFLPAIGIAVMVLIWWIASILYNNMLLFPSPLDTVLSAIRLFSAGDFIKRLANTLLRALISFGISYSCALVCAILCKLTNSFRLLRPAISTVRAVPTITIILLVLLWVGALTAPIIVALLVVFPTLFSMFASSLLSVDKQLIDVVKIEGGGNKDIVKYGYLPKLHPSLIEGAASGFSLSLKLVISAEAIAQTAASVGAFMKKANADFDPVTLFATALIVAVICILIEWAIPFADKIATKGKFEK